MEIADRQKLPTRAQSLIFRGKACVLRAKRATENLFDKNLKRFPVSFESSAAPVIAESKTALWTEKQPQEKFLVAGKIQNLRLAIQKINNLEIPAGALFSFWRHVRRTSRWKGYVAGRELREGCIIPNIGGGLCQLSNALYDAALKANFEIIERHAHSQIVPNSLAEQGRDATVFWNYVDLRFKSPHPFRIEAKLDAENLTVRLKSAYQPHSKFFQISKIAGSDRQNYSHPASCATCGVNDCFRVVKAEKEALNFGRTAFLLDEFSPEYDDFIQRRKKTLDFLFIPLDGKRFNKPNYAWNTTGFFETKSSFFVALARAYNSRRLAAQGAKRQTNLLDASAKLAASYAQKLPFDAVHLVVQQNLLPFLWREGVLGGRTFDVLMTALPFKDLQARLDYASSLHPESRTLADFRAEEWLIEAESEALTAARKIITSHASIAALFPEKAELLNWNLPPVKQYQNQTAGDSNRNSKPRIVFPASTVGRKGAYELREALRGLDIELTILGGNFEGEGFWRGFELTQSNFQNDWLANADLMVLPAFVEHKPRRLLQALVNGIPVIAAKSCGLENFDNLELVEAGDAFGLRDKVVKILAGENAFQKKTAHVAKSPEIFSK